MHKYTKEEIQFLKENVKGISLAELTKRFNDRFNLNVSESSITSIKHNNGLVSGYNKGQFKKGGIGNQRLPVGTIRKRKKDNRVYIKIAQPNVWKLYHHFVYENHYGVKIKKGDRIIFLDDNCNNFDINNLERVSSGENIFIAYNGGQRKLKHLTKTMIYIAKIKNKLKQLDKEQCDA